MTRLYLPRPRKPAAELPAPAVPTTEIVQREGDGLWFIGLADDSPGPFPTMQFAAAVAAKVGGAA